MVRAETLSTRRPSDMAITAPEGRWYSLGGTSGTTKVKTLQAPEGRRKEGRNTLVALSPERRTLCMFADDELPQVPPLRVARRPLLAGSRARRGRDGNSLPRPRSQARSRSRAQGAAPRSLCGDRCRALFARDQNGRGAHASAHPPRLRFG